MGKIVGQPNGDVRVYFTPEEVIVETFVNTEVALVTVGRAMAHAAQKRVMQTKYADRPCNVFQVRWWKGAYIVTLAFREGTEYNQAKENTYAEKVS